MTSPTPGPSRSSLDTNRRGLFEQFYRGCDHQSDEEDDFEGIDHQSESSDSDDDVVANQNIGLDLEVEGAEWQRVEAPEPDIGERINFTVRNPKAPKNINPDLTEPISVFFHLLFTEELMGAIVRQTNKYAADFLGVL
ncbi:hypothetical protein ElyMa_006396900 [Elysia marginata]|uniref:PiggyBac transposable element-derived protein domain-containing protein n=1 Tax=Elysia marginata TaxID=1093978 RepID=A0AAV4HU61_9GAST|nr:hypothetical protein ElyMa_006396900 [Elysia marginata]